MTFDLREGHKFVGNDIDLTPVEIMRGSDP
jgi:hypothetical protein